MNIIERAKNIIVTPKTEWLVISSESDTAQQVTMGYVLPLALAGAAAAFIGHSFLAGGHVAIGWGIYSAILVLVNSVLSVFISAFVVDALAPSFGSEKDFNRSARLVAYSFTPSLVGALLSIYPPIGIIGSLFGFYGIYLWYLGLGPMKHTPEDKKAIYLIVSILIVIAVYAVIGIVLAAILMPLFGLSNLSRFGGIA